jgi:hypothetical protein
MPPKSRSRKRTRGGAGPPSPSSQAAAAVTPAAVDTSFDFLANIPSPVTLLPSQGFQPIHSGTATSSVPSPSAQGAAPPSMTDSTDPYAFLSTIPCPVTIPSAPPHGQQSVTVTHVATTCASPAAPAAPAAPTVPAAPAAPSAPASHSAHHPRTPSAAPPQPVGDSAFNFLTNIPSPISLPPVHPGQGADTVRIFMFLSFQVF